MPTTDFLIFKKSPFSTIYINNIMNKINEDFKIVLSDKSAQDKDELEARKEIANVVQMIRNITRDDNILLQYNIQFGFLRNLMGGMIIAFIISFLSYKFLPSFRCNFSSRHQTLWIRCYHMASHFKNTSCIAQNTLC